MHGTGEYGCGCHSHHGHHDPGGGSYHHRGCCCGSGHRHRHFFTKEEVIIHLEEYLKQLQAEVTGVEERIAELRKG